jgi:hypothetical protein
MCSVHEQQKLGRRRLQQLTLFNYTALYCVLLYLPGFREQWWAFVIAVMNILVAKRVRNCWTTPVFFKLSGKYVYHRFNMKNSASWFRSLFVLVRC